MLLQEFVEECTPEAYTGEICLSILEQLQAEVLGTNDSDVVYIASGLDQKHSELFVQVMLYRIQLQECVEAFMPFMCQYLFPLCNTSGYLLLPSQEECLTISTGVCEKEWELVSLFAADYLPQCTDLTQSSTPYYASNH